MFRQSLLALAVLTAAGLSAPAPAARAVEDKSVSVELNKLEPSGSACRAYLVLKNGAGARFESLKLDLVLFDGDGIVARRLAVEAAPLAPGKTSLKVFDIEGLPCDRVGRVLLNDVLACEGGGLSGGDCMAALQPSARGAVPFIK